MPSVKGSGPRVTMEHAAVCFALALAFAAWDLCDVVWFAVVLDHDRMQRAFDFDKRSPAGAVANRGGERARRHLQMARDLTTLRKTNDARP